MPDRPTVVSETGPEAPDPDAAATLTAPSGPSAPTELQLEFCGEWHRIDPDQPYGIGREADLDVDENPYLHRRFLEVRWDQLWWLHNVGGQLAATVSDEAGLVHAWLAPGARLPLVFPRTVVRFTAGPTSYEITLLLDEAPMAVVESAAQSDGQTTIGRIALTEDQRLLIVALAEPTLRSGGGGRGRLPSTSEAATRLGWTTTKFNRKLDNVCEKLTKSGIAGLHGNPGQLASGRRARLVEYAVAVRLVTPDDLLLLPA